MNHKLTLAALAVLTTTLRAGPPAAPAPAPQPEHKFFTWDVQNRTRWEIKDDVFDFNNAVRTINDDNWVLNRLRIGIGIQPTDWLKFYAQGQDSREWLSDRADIPGRFGADGDDSFDLRLGYVDIGNAATGPWSLRLGRQLLSYGDERLIGTAEWLNLGFSFDAAKLTYRGQGWSVDAFSGTRVQHDRGSFNQSDLFNGTETHREQVFSGLYFNTKNWSVADTDLYALHLHEAGGTDFITLGTRLKSKPAVSHLAALSKDGCQIHEHTSPWDWDAEFAYQTGEVRGLDLSAFAAHAGIGYTLPGCPLKSRLGLEYNYATGDGNALDGDVETFQNLFPNNHKFYGFMDAFSWQNIHNVAVSWKAKPCKDVTARLDFHAFWLADTNDAWYRANGTTAVRGIAPGASNFAGTELDAVVTWQAHKNLALEFGYSHFFAGDYLSDTGTGDDADFGYVQATISF